MKPITILGRDPGTLVGRTGEVRAAADRIAERSLLTLTGVGGIGKTALAAEVAHEVEPGFDRVVVVELVQASDRTGVHRLVAGALEIDQLTEFDDVVAAVAARPTLVVLDNCEHVLVEAGALCEALVASGGPISILATSRRPLGKTFETLFAVPPLATPVADLTARPTAGSTARTSGLDVESTESGQLFIERVRRAVPDFVLTVDNRSAITTICELSSGLPLVLELAAALVRSRPLDQIVEALQDHPTSASIRSTTDRPDRQKSVAASIEWSLQFLDQAPRQLLSRVAVFEGGFSAGDAQAVAVDSTPNQVADQLVALVDHSLVRLDQDTQRYVLLEVMRHAVLALLSESERAQAEQAAVDRCCSIAESIAHRLYDADPSGTFSRFVGDLPNLVQTARRYERASNKQGLKSLVGPIATWWVHRVPVDRASWWREFLDIDVTDMVNNAKPQESRDAVAASDQSQIVALTAAAVWCSHRGDELNAFRLADEARKLSHSSPDRRPGLIAAIAASNSQLALGDQGGAVATLAKVITDATNTNFAYGELLARLNMVRIVEPEHRGHHLDRALVLAELGFHSLEGVIYAEQGRLALTNGDLRQALDYAERGLASARRHGYSESIGSALCVLAEVRVAQGDHRAATALYREALEVGERSMHHGVRERAESGLAQLPGRSNRTNESLVESLSDRELSVARLLRGDLTQREIGEELYIAPSTVKTHVKSIYRKLGVSKRSHAITRAAELGLFG